MIEISDLPHFTATFNGLSAACIAAGWVAIRSGRRDLHRKAMIAALCFSAMFLVVYLVYHFNAGVAKFDGEGWIRIIYFAILIPHVIMATVVTGLVPITVWRAAMGRFEAHRRIARWTLPIWLYVGASGVVVYVMAIHAYPYGGS